MIKRELWKGVLVLRKYFLMFTVILSLLIGACSNSADEKIDEIDKELTAHVNEATENAENAPYPKPETLYDHVYEQ